MAEFRIPQCLEVKLKQKDISQAAIHVNQTWTRHVDGFPGGKSSCGIFRAGWPLLAASLER